MSTGNISEQPNKTVQAYHGNERLVAFSDGVLSITITLLIFELKVPEIPSNLVGTELIPALGQLLPKILANIITFVVLGIYWISHHNTFMHIKKHDRALLWLNILFLMCVASMPFSSSLISRYPDEKISLIAYSGVLALAGIAMELMWWYGTTHNLVDGDKDADFVAFVHRRNLIPPAIYLLSILVCFISLKLAEFLIFVVVVLYIVPNPLDKKHYKELSKRLDE